MNTVDFECFKSFWHEVLLLQVTFHGLKNYNAPLIYFSEHNTEYPHDIMLRKMSLYPSLTKLYCKDYCSNCPNSIYLD